MYSCVGTCQFLKHVGCTVGTCLFLKHVKCTVDWNMPVFQTCRMHSWNMPVLKHVGCTVVMKHVACQSIFTYCFQWLRSSQNFCAHPPLPVFWGIAPSRFLLLEQRCRTKHEGNVSCRILVLTCKGCRRVACQISKPW